MNRRTKPGPGLLPPFRLPPAASSCGRIPTAARVAWVIVITLLVGLATIGAWCVVAWVMGL